MKNEVDKLLQKQMDRKAFLKHVGVGFVALTGFATLLKTLNSVSDKPKRTSGYGASAYGGDKQPAQANTSKKV